jgi:hypothetical protein
MVLSMWLQKVKFIAKKSKCANLTQEIGFFPHQIRAACHVFPSKRHNKVVNLQKRV